MYVKKGETSCSFEDSGRLLQPHYHPVSYAFDKDLGVLGRILWTIVVIALLAFAVYLNYRIWTQWEDGQVRISI